MLRYLRRNKSLAVGIVLLSLLALFVIVGNLTVDTDQARPLSVRALQPPSWAHPFGTDRQGRDLLAAMVAGTPLTLKIGFIAGILGVGIGTVLAFPLEARNVTKTFGGGLLDRDHTLALEDFSFAIDAERPSITAIVGESGSGKTTLARLLLGLVGPTSGQVLYQGRDVHALSGTERRAFRRDVQAIFQDPYGVYNPFYRVDHVLTTPVAKFRLAKSKSQARGLIENALRAVGLSIMRTVTADYELAIVFNNLVSAARRNGFSRIDTCVPWNAAMPVPSRRKPLPKPEVSTICVGMPVVRISLSTSRPSFSGMIMSIITISGRYSRNTSVAASGSLIALNSMPSALATKPTILVIPAWSSIIRSFLAIYSSDLRRSEAHRCQASNH